MKFPAELIEVVVSKSDVLGGRPCFVGTRVPLDTLLDHIEAGCSVEQFLRGYSGVKAEHARAVLEWQARESRRLVGYDLAS